MVSMVADELLCDIIRRKENLYEKLFSPSRGRIDNLATGNWEHIVRNNP